MEFKQHVVVLNADGQELGRLARVVIEPKSNEVTHLVIRRGWLTVHDKVLPLERVEIGAEDGIIVRLTLDEFDQLPDLEEAQFVTVDESKLGKSEETDAARPLPAIYWLPTSPHSPLLPNVSGPTFRATSHLNIPAGTVAVKEGAQVIARDGKRAGQVDEVLTADKGERITYVLISSGQWVKEKKLIPISWIETLGENEVHLAVESGTIDRLPAYDHA